MDLSSIRGRGEIAKVLQEPAMVGTIGSIRTLEITGVSSGGIAWQPLADILFPDEVSRDMVAMFSILGAMPSAASARLLGLIEFGAGGASGDNMMIDLGRGKAVPVHGSYCRLSAGIRNLTAGANKVIVAGHVGFGQKVNDDDVYNVLVISGGLAAAASTTIDLNTSTLSNNAFSMIAYLRALTGGAGDTFLVEFLDAGGVLYSAVVAPGESMEWAPIESQVSSVRITNLDPVNAIASLRVHGRITG